jgi:hypothetical protein
LSSFAVIPVALIGLTAVAAIFFFFELKFFAASSISEHGREYSQGSIAGGLVIGP